MEMDEDSHIKNIEDLADCLSEEFRGLRVLKDDRFRIGIAQKALNLYLKYLWCTDQICMPPHCPFDSMIISKLPGCKDIKWTTLLNIDDYRRLVKAARAQAGDKPIAQWELETYQGLVGK
jgi:hypothetical protein